MVVRGWLAQELLRHARRRGAGMTTVSVLVGEPQRMLRELADCTTGVVQTLAASSAEMASEYLAQVVGPDGLRGAALQLLAPELGNEALQLPAWERRSPRERALWLDQVQQRPLSTSSACALRWLVLCQYPDELGPTARLALLSEWYTATPVLALVAVTPEGLAQAVQLASDVHRLSIVLMTVPQSLERLLEAQKPRVRALLQEAVIRAPEPQGEPSSVGSTEPQRSAPSAGAMDVASPSAQDAEALQELARESYRQAREASERGEPHTRERADRARSEAERFLYALLQRSQVTRGLFALNVLLPFQFGNRRLEADFAARSLYVVLEVDGYYHFTDAEAYRRDRRKDLLLQQHAYLVARFLADDVLAQPDEVVRQIEQLVIARRAARAKEA